MSAIRTRRRKPLSSLRKIIFKDKRGSKNKSQNLPEPVFSLSPEEALEITPEIEPPTKRVSLLNQEAAEIPKKSKSKKKKAPVKNNALPAPSLLVTKNNNPENDENNDNVEDENELEKIRQELLCLRNKLATTDSPSASPAKPKTRKTRKRRARRNDTNAENMPNPISSPLRNQTCRKNIPSF